MNRLVNRLRAPVRRQSAEQYLLVTLVSFAASVGVTRLFLELTGYPQLGNQTLHIAHVLWGGLLLFAASLLPLIFANRWAFSISALLAGVGVGLFIDEVGKFITQSNDYFYPAAAPIIYAFFLITVLIYLQVRRPPARDARAGLYRVFEALQEVLDRDLDPQEHAELEAQLHEIIKRADQPELAHLAQELLDFTSRGGLSLAPDRPSLLERLERLLSALEKRLVNRKRLRFGLSVGLAVMGIVSFARLIELFAISAGSDPHTYALNAMLAAGPVSGAGGIPWFLARLGIEGVTGALLLAAGVILFVSADHTTASHLAISMGLYGLLLALTVVNLLVFYFDQFSTIITAMIQFGLFLGLVYYRRSNKTE